MFDNVNLSKFRVPAKQKGFLHRARLIDWMHENSHRKLTYISAPAGFGKTSLLVDFACDVEGRICWFLVTPGDQELRKFAWDLILSIRQSFPNFGKEIESHLRTNPGGIDHVSLANDFINDALTCIDDYCLLFIDDYHIVADSDEVTGFFELFLDYLPDGIRIVSASRTEFGIPTGKLYARNQINLMNVDQLRFRSGELQQLIAKAYRIKLTDREAQELANRSDGWIVAVMLAASSMKWGRLLEFQGSTEYVYSFLAQEVIERESEQLQQFMLAMSVVDEFNLQIAGYIFQEGNAENLIQELERRNLFVTRVETQEGSAYRFHQLFLEFLRHRLDASNFSRRQVLHQRAAEWYELAKDQDNAIQHYLEVGDRTSAARLMDYVAKHHFVYGANARVEAWLDILSGPPDLRSQAPELLLNRAKFLVDQYRLSEAEQLLEIADEVFEKTGETDKILNSLSVRGVIFWQQGQYEKAMELIALARGILKGKITGELYPGRAQQFDRMEGLCIISQGDYERGINILTGTIQALIKILEAVEPRTRKIQVVHDLVLGYETVGLFTYQKGRIYESLRNFLDAFQLREKYLRNNQGLIFSLNNIGYIYYQIGDFQKAYRYLIHALQILETIEKGQASIHLFSSMADLMRDLDEWDEAEKFLKAAIKVSEDAQTKKKDLDIGGTYKSYMALERVRGNFDRAIYHLHESFRLRKMSPDKPEFFASLGAIYYCMGQYDLAIETMLKADVVFDEADVKSEAHAAVDYLIGSAHFHRGDTEVSLDYLQRALSRTAAMGYDQFFISEGRHSIDYLKFAAKALPGLSQIKSVIKRVEEYQTGKSQLVEAVEEAPDSQEQVWLEASGFGDGRIRLNGDVIRKSDWRANMARALFYYILDREGVTGAEIKLEFWPDKSGPKATSNFQSTLWRARNALQGLNILVLENNRCIISRDVKVWYDASEFSELLKRAKATGISESERMDLFKSALDLVQGDFLPDIYLEWANDRRIQLQRQYQSALEELGYLVLARARYEEAIRYFERLMKIDPYRDDIQLALLKCFHLSGSAGLATSRYREYEKFLEEEGLKPSKELVSFFTAISGSQK